MELWDLYTRDRIKTGETHIRGVPLPNDRYHLVVNVWIKNSESKYLISRRSKTRISNPLKFEPVAGSALKGETSIDAAMRETKEEVGVDLDMSMGKLVHAGVRKKLNAIVDVWLFKYDGEVDLKNATTDEVESVKWMTKNEIYKLYDSGMMVNNIAKYMNMIFQLSI